MKKYNELTEKQQKQAVLYMLNDFLNGAADGSLFTDNDELQAAIHEAISKAEALQTPWFAKEYLTEDKYIMEAFQGMAQVDAENAIYLQEEEIAVSLQLIDSVEL